MSFLNLRRSIKGFNITENGVRSFSKPIRIGPINATINGSADGISLSLGLRGTGIYKHGIELVNFKKATQFKRIKRK